ncbi:Broad specificity phosphatase PhoE [Burkholderia sp. OK233]|nr:Broad specificity phosphatase PhoE [Burkholderia sp. OK233]
MGQIFLVRHGQASFGKDDYDCLSELGHSQAKLLGRWFNSCGLPLERVIAGGMQRHFQTAKTCVAAWGDTNALQDDDPLEIDERLNEFDHVDVIDVYRNAALETSKEFDEHMVNQSAIPFEEWKRIWGLAMERWMSSASDASYKETWSAFRRRCLDAFDMLTDGEHPAKTVAAFTSGGPIAAICQSLLHLDDRATRELIWSLANTGVTRLLFTKGRRGLGSLNSTAHVDWARAPNMLTYR